LLTRSIALALRAARRLGALRVLREIPAREIDAYAHGVAYLIGARTWMLWHRAAPWSAIHAEWRRSLAAGADAVRAALSGALDPADRVRLLGDGPEAFAERARLYARARLTLDISTYYLQSDETGWSTVRELETCVRRGVRVRVLADRFMIGKKRREVEGIDQMLDALRRAGVELRLWHDPDRPFDSNHRKMVLGDGAICLVGGRNYADHYRDGSWRDVELVIEGPTAAQLAPLFERAWRGPGAATADVGGSDPGPWVDHVPSRIGGDPVMRYVLACIELAARTVDLELAYFVGPAVLTKALCRAARRGVRVRLHTNSAETTDLPFATRAAYAGMAELLDAGVAVFARRGAGRTLHSKYMVADGAQVGFGSHNLDYYSSRFCCETNLQVRSAGLGRLLTEFFEAGLADSPPVDRERDIRPVLERDRALRRLDWALRDFQ